MSCGQPDDALCVLARSGRRKTPSPPLAQMQIVCEAHLLCGRYADAIEAGERSLGLGSSDDFDTHVCLVAANQNVGDTAKASNAMEAVLRLQPRYTIAIHRSRSALAASAISRAPRQARLPGAAQRQACLRAERYSVATPRGVRIIAASRGDFAYVTFSVSDRPSAAIVLAHGVGLGMLAGEHDEAPAGVGQRVGRMARVAPLDDRRHEAAPRPMTVVGNGDAPRPCAARHRRDRAEVGHACAPRRRCRSCARPSG